MKIKKTGWNFITQVPLSRCTCVLQFLFVGSTVLELQQEAKFQTMDFENKGQEHQRFRGRSITRLMSLVDLQTKITFLRSAVFGAFRKLVKF